MKAKLGRPAILRKCPECKAEFPTRALREHVRECRLAKAVRRVIGEMQERDPSLPQYACLGKGKQR